MEVLANANLELKIRCTSALKTIIMTKYKIKNQQYRHKIHNMINKYVINLLRTTKKKTKKKKNKSINKLKKKIKISNHFNISSCISFEETKSFFNCRLVVDFVFRFMIKFFYFFARNPLQTPFLSVSKNKLEIL